MVADEDVNHQSPLPRTFELKHAPEYKRRGPTPSRALHYYVAGHSGRATINLQSLSIGGSGRSNAKLLPPSIWCIDNQGAGSRSLLIQSLKNDNK